MKKETRSLEVELTDNEIESYGRELAAILVKKEKLEVDRKAINDRIKPLTDRVKVLAPIIEDGKEFREVACEWEYDYEMNERTLFRNDTGEVVTTDIIPEHERQANLL